MVWTHVQLLLLTNGLLIFFCTPTSTKLSKTSAVDIIDECYEVFNLKRVSQLVTESKRRFLSKFLGGSDLSRTFINFAVTELNMVA
jgi:hypothetical protein